MPFLSELLPLVKHAQIARTGLSPNNMHSIAYFGQAGVLFPAKAGRQVWQNGRDKLRYVLSPPGWSSTEKEKVFWYTDFPKKPAGTPCVQPWLVAVGGWWGLVVGGWQLAVGGG